MTSALVVGQNTFGSLAAFRAYMADSVRGQALATVDDDLASQALITAVRLFQRLRWSGQRTGLQVLASVSVAAGGTGYAVGNVLTVVGGTTEQPAQARVTAVSAGVVTAVALLDAGLYEALPSSPAATTGGGSGCTLSLVAEAQQLCMPRTGLTDVDGQAVDPNLVPVPVVEAEFELAFEITQNAKLETSPGTGSNVKLAKAGPAEVEFFRPTDGPRNQRFPVIVQELIAPFLGGSGPTLAITSGTDGASAFTPDQEYGFSQGLP